MNKVRVAVAALTLSFAGFMGIALREHYTDDAVIPTKGDVPTIGYGSTVNEDGTPVRMGDRTDPIRALVKAKAHIDREEQAFRESLPGVHLTQGEFDLYMDFVYQYGIGNWRSSSMRRELRATLGAEDPARHYRAACDALLRYRYADDYDCSTTINGKPNKRCWGVWTRQQERHAKCLAEQQ